MPAHLKRDPFAIEAERRSLCACGTRKYPITPLPRLAHGDPIVGAEGKPGSVGRHREVQEVGIAWRLLESERDQWNRRRALPSSRPKGKPYCHDGNGARRGERAVRNSARAAAGAR